MHFSTLLTPVSLSGNWVSVRLVLVTNRKKPVWLASVPECSRGRVE